MIIRCSECQEPMTESIKNRPPNLPDNVKWVTCKQCDRGIEVVDGKTEDMGKVSAIEYTQTVTVTQYVTIKKTKDGVTRQIFSDPARTILINEEKIS